MLCCSNVRTSVRQVDDERDITQSRPVSPVSFMRETLDAAKDALNESRSRLKRSKKDHSKHLSSQRAEIDSLKTRVGTGDKGDERTYRRILYLRGFVKRAQEEAEGMESERRALIEAQEANEEEWRLKKEEWQVLEAALHEAEKVAIEHKQKCDERVSHVQSEKSTFELRRDKLLARRAKLEQDYDNVGQERDAIGRRQTEEARQRREELAQRRKRIEGEFSVNIQKMERAILDRQRRTMTIRQAIEAQRSSIPSNDLRKSISSETT